MAVEVTALSRRSFLGIDSALEAANDFAGKSRGKQGRRPIRLSSGSTPPPSRPTPPDWRSVVTSRRVALGVTAGGAALILLQPWQWFVRRPVPPDAIPSVVPPTPDAELDQALIRLAEAEVFNLAYYPKNLRQKMVSHWKFGHTSLVNYSKPNRELFYLEFKPAQPRDQMINLAATNIQLRRVETAPNQTSLVLSLQGEYVRSLGVGIPRDIERRLEEMNFEHEAIVSLAYINALTTIAGALGLDLKADSPKSPKENELILMVKAYNPAIVAMAEAVAEINDYLLTEPLVDKDPSSGQTVWSPQNLPLIAQGMVFMEGGLHHLVDSAIGSALKGIPDLEVFAGRYKSLGEIPNSDQYYQKIKEHYQKHPPVT
ncbi:hypothetical protein HYW42_03455 [Candidatus Daviesbacteria bacterium]|nr:hypothetical protein [Candidatus Daviesbacteria bacterium]